MAEVAFKREETQIDGEISQLDRLINDAEGRNREETRHSNRTDYPRLRAAQLKVASIQEEIHDHIRRMEHMRTLPLAFMDRAREWVLGRQRHLEWLKQQLTVAEAQPGREMERLMAGGENN
jgi:hypothetical protein